jgi:predicted nucleotidyltransferase
MKECFGMVDNIIELVGEKLSSLSYIECIVLGGSRARGTHTEDSDIDIGIYYHSESFDLITINQLAAELDDEHRSNLIAPPGAWGNWVNGGGWLIIQGHHVDLILRDIKHVEQVMKDTNQGIVTANYQTGHPHGYISVMYRGELGISKILFARSDSFCELKKQAETYPSALQKGLTDFFMFEACFSLMFAKDNIDKDDISYVCGHCFRSISCLNQVLFAMNEEYCINEKKAVRMIGVFKIKPCGYKEKIDKIISLISSDVDSTRKGIDILEGLINEVESLKGVSVS